MDELAEILLIKKKYRNNKGCLYHEFIKDGRVREFLRKKIYQMKILYTILKKEKLKLYTGKYPCIVMELAFSIVFFCFSIVFFFLDRKKKLTCVHTGKYLCIVMELALV
jgi:hypothetical protein